MKAKGKTQPLMPRGGKTEDRLKIWRVDKEGYVAPIVPKKSESFRWTIVSAFQAGIL